jgi:hypothetical protein
MILLFFSLTFNLASVYILLVAILKTKRRWDDEIFIAAVNSPMHILWTEAQAETNNDRTVRRN